MAEANGCSLCRELQGSVKWGLWPQYFARDIASRVVAQNASYAAMVTLGPIVRGHCLVVPREHMKSMAAATGVQRRRAVDLLHQLSAMLRVMYRAGILVFEHGASENSMCSPCSVDHAHWHVVPTAVRATEMLRGEYSWERAADLFVSSSSDYLLVADDTNDAWVAYPDKPAPSQVLRMQLATCIGATRHWDWRAEPALDRVLGTIGDFRALLS